jgi:hypothetical protein
MEIFWPLRKRSSVDQRHRLAMPVWPDDPPLGQGRRVLELRPEPGLERQVSVLRPESGQGPRAWVLRPRTEVDP